MKGTIWTLKKNKIFEVATSKTPQNLIIYLFSAIYFECTLIFCPNVKEMLLNAWDV